MNSAKLIKEGKRALMMPTFRYRLLVHLNCQNVKPSEQTLQLLAQRSEAGANLF
jgi:hypothetical protein